MNWHHGKKPAPAQSLEVILCDPDTNHVPLLAGDFHLTRTTSLERLIELSCKRKPVAVALPLNWPRAPLLEDSDTPILQFLRSNRHRLAIIVYADTTKLPIGVYCRALCAGARRVINECSPTFADDLRNAIQDVVSGYRLQCEEEDKLASLFAKFGLLGISPGLREVFRRALRASQFNDLPVLILGETGTGKQRLAEAIHRLDPKRSQNPFLTVNCSAISKTLAESELFGHTKGAFSGAGHDRVGLFRAANNGSLLLDEVGELDLDLQPKLLRVLQERRLLPVGADYEHPINIRIIAATNRPLEKMVAAGKFREDLYQRLNVFQIRIPPLRERPEDIEVQARHFLRIYQNGRNEPVEFAPGVLDALRILPLEGNTRHLENLIRETLTFKERGNLLQLEDLPFWALEKLAMPSNVTGTTQENWSKSSLPQQISLAKAIAEFERSMVCSLLEKNGGNRARTAKDLRLTPRTLYNKIKKYRLLKPSTKIPSL